MKSKLGLLSLALLSGCMTTDPNGYVDLLKGSGSMQTGASGQQSFRYAISANAYRDLLDDESDLKAQHTFLIESWLGDNGYCPRGYTITGSSIQEGIYLYTGNCR